MGTLEAKLDQHLARLAHKPPFQVFLDVWNDYDSLDWELCLELLGGYRVGPNLARILENYWRRQRIVPKVSKYLGTAFWTGRGVTQGDPASLMIFNIVVDALVRAVLVDICISKEAHHDIGWEFGERNLVVNADDGRIAGKYYEWMQDSLTVTVATFRQRGLDTNLGKPSQCCAPPGSSWGSGGSWPISDGRRDRGKLAGSGRRQG